MAEPFVGPDFPKTEEVEGLWVWDKFHAPRPITPLSDDLIWVTLGEGFTQGQDRFACPLGMDCRSINYYTYASFVLMPEMTTEMVGERMKRYQHNLDQLVPKVGQLWETEWLPGIKPEIIRARDANYDALSDRELIGELDHQRKAMIDRWAIHGSINFILIAASSFRDFWNQEFKPEDETEGYEALAGFETRSLAGSRGLWRLSRAIKKSPALTKLFEELDPKELPAALDKTPEGQAFMKDLRAYLDEFGWRGDAVYDIADVTWREEPSIPLNTLQGFIRLGDEGDPDIIFNKAVAKREQLLADARQKLANNPEKLAKLEELYEAARLYIVVTEDHSYWIDSMSIAAIRRLALACGQRLVQKGVIDKPDDVFYLRLAELKDSLGGNTADRRQVTRERRDEMAKWSRAVPPLSIGVPPPESDDPFVESLLVRFLGPFIEPEREPDLVKGIPAAPGVIQGVAKVVRSLNEASKLSAGDIMVCEMTLPPWTPLFSNIGGVVADTGGVLSHCAIVSREYHIPAVVGTVIGTTTIKDGMTITVDGTKGIVRIDAR